MKYAVCIQKQGLDKPTSHTKQFKPCKFIETSSSLMQLTNYYNVTFPFMVFIFDILHYFQGLFSFLDFGWCPVELVHLGLGIKDKNIIMVQWSSCKRYLHKINKNSFFPFSTASYIKIRILNDILQPDECKSMNCKLKIFTYFTLTTRLPLHT